MFRRPRRSYSCCAPVARRVRSMPTRCWHRHRYCCHYHLREQRVDWGEGLDAPPAPPPPHPPTRLNTTSPMSTTVRFIFIFYSLTPAPPFHQKEILISAWMPPSAAKPCREIGACASIAPTFSSELHFGYLLRLLGRF